MSRGPRRLIQVGLGAWGRDWHANVLSRSTEVELVGFVDADTDALASAQELLSLPPERCFGTLAEAAAATHADAVVVPAALPAHVPVALEALDAGLDVLLEKPFAPSVADALGVVARAADRGRVLMVSQNYRFFPAVRAAAALVRDGALGPVDSVHVDFRRDAHATEPPGHRHFTIAQPLLLDMSIHHFDLMRLILGQEAREVVCRAWNAPWSRFVEPAAGAATIVFDGGTVVSYRGSWVSSGPATPWSGEWRIDCRDGEIAFASRGDAEAVIDRLTVRERGGEARPMTLPEIGPTGRAGVLAAFLEAVRTRAVPETDGRANLGTMALTHAAIASATTGEPQLVSVPDAA